MNKLNKIGLIIAFIVLVLNYNVMAQVPPPPAQGTPIDGGALFMLIAGAVYGVKKIYSKNKKRNE